MPSLKWGIPTSDSSTPRSPLMLYPFKTYYLTIIKLLINYFSLKKSLSVYFVETTSEASNIKRKIAPSEA